jgi:hypothetical protein
MELSIAAYASTPSLPAGSPSKTMPMRFPASTSSRPRKMPTRRCPSPATASRSMSQRWRAPVLERQRLHHRSDLRRRRRHHRAHVAHDRFPHRVEHAFRRRLRSRTVTEAIRMRVGSSLIRFDVRAISRIRVVWKFSVSGLWRLRLRCSRLGRVTMSNPLAAAALSCWDSIVSRPTFALCFGRYVLAWGYRAVSTMLFDGLSETSFASAILVSRPEPTTLIRKVRVRGNRKRKCGNNKGFQGRLLGLCERRGPFRVNKLVVAQILTQ